jgi:hypothetical protein
MQVVTSVGAVDILIAERDRQPGRKVAKTYHAFVAAAL